MAAIPPSRLEDLTKEEFWASVREKRARPHRAAKAFAAAIAVNDRVALSEALREIGDCCAWQLAMMAVRRLPAVPEEMSQWFLSFWLQYGDTIRDSVNDDLVLFDGLRILMPPYVGPTIKLYRGDSAHNRSRRTYGPSWTAEQSVAEGFAQGIWQACDGGSVVVESLVPPDAILCSPHLLGDEYEEAEYLVDRRRLSGVTVVRRYPQVPIEERMVRSGAQNCEDRRCF